MSDVASEILAGDSCDDLFDSRGSSGGGVNSHGRSRGPEGPAVSSQGRLSCIDVLSCHETSPHRCGKDRIVTSAIRRR